MHEPHQIDIKHHSIENALSIWQKELKKNINKLASPNQSHINDENILLAQASSMVPFGKYLFSFFAFFIFISFIK